MQTNKTILVIEDNKDLRESIVMFLEESGFVMLEASNGKNGILVAEKHQPDLIICDIAMPEINGFDVIKALQRKEKYFFTPFIFLTAKTEREDMREGMELGADDYITKPFDFNELLKSIHKRLFKSDLLLNMINEKIYDALDNPFLCVIVKKDGDFVHVNEKFMHTFGFSVEDLVKSGFELFEVENQSTQFETDEGFEKHHGHLTRSFKMNLQNADQKVSTADICHIKSKAINHQIEVFILQVDFASRKTASIDKEKLLMTALSIRSRISRQMEQNKRVIERYNKTLEINT